MHINEHYENRSKVPSEVLAKYVGRHVAWNREGTQIVASGDDDGEVFAAVKAAGIPTDQVVFSYVPQPDEVWFGGAFLSGEAT